MCLRISVICQTGWRCTPILEVSRAMTINNYNSHLLSHLSTRHNKAFSNNAASKIKTDCMPPGQCRGWQGAASLHGMSAPAPREWICGPRHGGAIAYRLLREPLPVRVPPPPFPRTRFGSLLLAHNETSAGQRGGAQTAFVSPPSSCGPHLCAHTPPIGASTHHVL